MNIPPQISIAGRHADAIFKSFNLTVTQGGEPTFVPEDTKAPEWNVAALGAEKLAAGRTLARCLIEKAFPGAILIHSTGKHYPGEPLPRWSLGIFYSTSGKKLWNSSIKLKLDRSQSKKTLEPIFAEQFARALAGRLGVDASLAQAVYEDIEGQMRLAQSKGKKMPLPVFDRSKEQFIAEEFSSHPDSDKWREFFKPRGYVIPLEYEADKWRSQKWTFGVTEEITLLPGESSIGLRLPLSKLSEDDIKTALTVQIDGHGDLCIFLPPVDTLPAFYCLVEAIGATCTKMECPPIILEGYPPPSSEDIQRVTLIPDPGVLEINLPPAATWDEFEKFSKMLYLCADQAGLQGYKYQFSGRKVSTGGGSHIILGGPDLKDNPFLKVPHLLPSFIRFFQNHPSLSYIFTGLFVGPSSQAPRVDESFFDLLYELNLSLCSIEAMKSPADPAKIDMILRNLLLDWNGNTHRAEISVDKFHNPHMPNGRLGLVEFRAFEMMPTIDMFLEMNVLLRALAACFVIKPYTSGLVDWEHRLHDELALPYFLKKDMAAVIAFINENEFDLDSALFDSHIDFRFPVVKTYQSESFDFILRQAIEPWPVLGEQPTSTGTVARSVDASTDRLEILIRTTKPFEFPVISINGHRAPLIKQGDCEAICAVRYRLFDLECSLQPQVKAHSPLEFEIIDRLSGNVLNAFDYLNWKAKAGDYDGLPRNPKEARGRVEERLLDQPEKEGKPRVPKSFESDKRAPYTIDLRRLG